MRQGVLCGRVGRKLKFGDKRDYIVYTELKFVKSTNTVSRSYAQGLCK